MNLIVILVLAVVGLIALSMFAGWVIRGMWEKEKRMENNRIVPGRVLYQQIKERKRRRAVINNK